MAHAAETPPRILVADDDPHIRDLLVILLTDEGYRVVAAVDGLDAQVTAEREHPDVILVDVMMPGLTGAQFCRAYRDGGGVAPVILISAGDPKTIAATVEACGAVAFIPKPFDIDDVLETVARLLRG